MQQRRIHLPSLLLLVSLHVLPSRSQPRPVLRQVNVIFRHGARTANKPFPTDPHLQYWQHEGLGELTQVGMCGSYSLGQYLRQTYNSLLDDTFKAKQLYVRSTDVDRTLMTAECVLAGLYPPKEGENWNKFIAWTPVPVHTEKRQEDTLLEIDELECPLYDDLFAEIINSDNYKKWEASHSELYAKLTNYTGLPGPLDADTAWDIWDTLFCEKTQNLTWPDWVTEEIYNTMGHDIIPRYAQLETAANPEMMKIHGGTLLWQILQNMRGKITGQDVPNMYLYSAHDKNILLLLSMFGLFDNTMVPFNAALMMELYEMDTEQYAVKLVYKPSPNQQSMDMRYSDCPLFCPVDIFADKTRGIQLDPVDWKEACHVNKGASAASVALGIGALLVLVLLMVLLLIIIIRISRRNRKPYTNMERAPLIPPSNT